MPPGKGRALRAFFFFEVPSSSRFDPIDARPRAVLHGDVAVC
jgi:hypothetical protein